MNAPQFPPIDPATIGAAMRNARAYQAAEQICRNAGDLHKPRHYRIGRTTFDTVCIAIAVLAVAYFAAELLRGAF
jgi:hypothetical protein